MSQPPPRVLYPTLFFCIVLVGVSIICISVLTPFFVAIAWAIVLAIGFRAPWHWIVRKLPKRRVAAAAIASTLIALVVIVPAALLAIVLYGQAAEAVSRFSAQLRSQHIRSVQDVVTIPSVARVVQDISARAGLTPADIQAKLADVGTAASAYLAARSAGVVLSLLDAVITFATTIFLLFFFLRDGDEMTDAVTDLIPLRGEDRVELIRRLRKMVQSIFRGSLLCALIQGASGAVGWAFAGLPSPVLAGAVMGILSLLPIGGTAIVWAPGAIWLWLDGRHGPAIFLALWGIIVTSFVADNVLKPWLIGGTGELNTLVVFLGVFGGLSAFGLLGIFIGPLALALAATLLEMLRGHARKSELVPTLGIST
ncbi:MAG: AI-2E family transporter [Thermoanaerobaculia bacterium]